MLSDCLTADYKHVKVIHFILKQIPALRIAGEIPQQARNQSPGVRNSNQLHDPEWWENYTPSI